VKGTGLGLPLSKRLAELLGGSLSVQSAVGFGSTFSVRLPIIFLDGEKSSDERVAMPGPKGSGPSILFVDDNLETNFVHESSLRSMGYQLSFARNIPEARAALRTSTPALVALDRFIEEEDRLDFIHELKSSGFAGPIVVISVVDDAQAALAAGADRFLAKPVAPFRLASTFRELLQGKTSNRVLITDDDEVTRYLLAEALTSLGYDVVEAHGGRQAIQSMTTHILSGVFLDIVMPDLTGFEVLREVRRNPLTEAIPVIVHSSKDLSPQEIERLAGFGAVVFPKREFSSEEGLKKLREVIASAGFGH
jgi:CheY-like chemotaxis protein